MKRHKTKAAKKFRLIHFTKRGCRFQEWVDTWEFPRSPETYDAMTKQMMKAVFPLLYWTGAVPEEKKIVSEQISRAALRALGITRPKEEKTK